MITGLNLDETVDYTLENDKENPTVWKLGVISSYLYSRLTAESQPLEGSFRILQIAIKGWENFTIPFRTKRQTVCGRDMEVLPLEDLEKIPMRVLTELYTRILIINNLKDDEIKN